MFYLENESPLGIRVKLLNSTAIVLGNEVSRSDELVH